MHYVTPSTHLIAATEIDEAGLDAVLTEFGAPGWTTDAGSGAEKLTEVCGRFCYKSFDLEMNRNLTRIREGNEVYIGQSILGNKHGSVLEHSYATFAFLNVSPVLTHELVRHRAGLAFSQVSLRFVRLTEIGTFFPSVFGEEFIRQLFASIPDETWKSTPSGADDWHMSKENEARAAAEDIKAIWEEIVGKLEQVQLRLAKYGRLDQVTNFGLKKKFTSAMRRLAPYGLATGIVATANHRAFRHMIAQRTSRHAEEEIRLAFGQIAKALAERFPNIYQDMRGEVVDDLSEYTFENEKV